MADNQVITNIINYGPEIAIKWMTVIGLVMYAIFALVILRQTAIMTETIDSDMNVVVKLFAWMHLAMAIALVVLTAVWL